LPGNRNQSIDEVVPEVTHIRRKIHTWPELAFEEKVTSSLVADYLEASGIEVTRGVAGTGVVGLIRNKSERTIALRADMDALPLIESSKSQYVSQNVGKAHACGHDGHTAVLLGAAKVLSKMSDQLQSNVKFIFQPAEEQGTGAKRMIEEGVLDSPHIDAIFGLHSWPNLPAGEIGIRYGPMMASTDRFELTIHGKGGHAAHPHKAIDPIVIAARVIDSFQTIVSRQTSPVEPAVLTIGRIQGGTTHNAIPDSVEMEGTIRTLNPATREQIISSMKRIAENASAMSSAPPPVLKIQTGTPALINDSRIVDVIDKIGRRTLGENSVRLLTEPSMGGEDFAYYTLKVPGAMFRLGVASETGPTESLHSSSFGFNDDAIKAGISVLVGVVEDFHNLDLGSSISP
jgi:amidohydrolase